MPLEQLLTPHQLAVYQSLAGKKKEQFEASCLCLAEQLDLLTRPREAPVSYTPLQSYQTEGDPQRGIACLKKGSVGTIVLAGGIGSRLGQLQPKGMFPISCVKRKTLFQLLAERTKAAGIAYGTYPSMAIMTSQDTHEQTAAYFADSNFFDLPQETIRFFTQSSLPLIDEESKLLLCKDGQPLTAPDGNGSFFLSFVASGLLDQWAARGIEHVTIVQIDNPLVDPFCPELIGLHVASQNDITAGAVLRSSADEKVGVFIEKEGKAQVVEYSELLPQEREAIEPNGTLKYPLANISFFAFRLSFLRRMAQNPCLPLHKAKKNLTEVQKQALDEAYIPQAAWKFEYFIFDLLTFAARSSVLLLDRREVFHPLKNSSGEYGPESVQRALYEKDRRRYAALFGKEPPADQPLELDMQMYYSSCV